ncbi:phage antirepressor N-terminal domain-containing protein [Serratia sp. M24T3]|uniref:phage antirepressor N-terminal domain-containing protein n=1 Tax=Serratia sp. M24T3 TaxID=932213 RepID=UPI00025B8F2B|nr:phage antirepressor N-terminal domain-containing protein [Serratia sp. M24T3]EIC83969.1 antirepressor protein [Serratia sp. M24T3]
MNSIAIIEAVNTTSLPFHGQSVITAMAAGVAYVAMKPVVENIGLNWKGQYIKLINQMDKFGCGDISIPTNGGLQRMLCIPLKKLNGWLFSINPAKVRDDIRDRLIRYQEECFTALHDYWTKGAAVRRPETTVDDRTPLRGIVNRIMGKYGLTYQAVYKLVHKEFGVNHIDELSPRQTAEAVEYLAGKVIEGEWMPKQEVVTDFSTEVHNINAACTNMDVISEIWRNELHPSLVKMGSPLAVKLYDRINDSCMIVKMVRNSLELKTGLKGMMKLE